MAEVIQERMKKLQESTVSDNVVLKVLANIGLSNHGILAAETCMSILYSVLVEKVSTFAPGISYKKVERQRGLFLTFSVAFSPISLELLPLQRFNSVTNSNLNPLADFHVVVI